MFHKLWQLHYNPVQIEPFGLKFSTIWEVWLKNLISFIWCRTTSEIVADIEAEKNSDFKNDFGTIQQRQFKRINSIFTN